MDRAQKKGFPINFSDNLLTQVRHTIEKHGMLNTGDKIVVGVSGGADSVALTYLLFCLLKEYNLYLYIAHLDHGFRGEESKKDAEFVKNLARKLDLPFQVKFFDVPSYKKEKKISSQEAARIIRYQFFSDIFKELKADKIALGHNADDQAETILLRLIKGTGMRGLKGILPKRENTYIRPLIEISRQEIEEFLARYRIPFVTDSSNKENFYLRNRIRHHLLPLLAKEYDPQIVSHLNRMGDYLREEDCFLEKIAAGIFPSAVTAKDETSLSLSIPYLLALPRALRFRLARKGIEAVCGNMKGIRSSHFYSIFEIIEKEGPGKSLSLPGNISAKREYQELIIRKETKTIPSFFYSFEKIPESVVIAEINKKITFTVEKKVEKIDLQAGASIAYFDYEKVEFPIVIRNFRNGDRFCPLGMEGKKKIKDFFIDQKIPLSKRKEIPFLLFNNKIAWVMELRLDNRVRVTGNTKTILQAEFS